MEFFVCFFIYCGELMCAPRETVISFHPVSFFCVVIFCRWTFGSNIRAYHITLIELNFFLTSLSSIKSLWSALADTRQRYDFTLKKTTKILGPATIFPGTEVPVSQCSAIARLLFTFRRKKKKITEVWMLTPCETDSYSMLFSQSLVHLTQRLNLSMPHQT